MLNNWRDKIFIVVVLVILISPTLILIRGQKDVSSLENRTLSKVPSFISATILSDFLGGNFQDQLENGLSDQMLLGSTMKLSVNSLENLAIDSMDKIIYHDNDCRRTYIPIKESLYNYDCSDYIVYKKEDTSNLSAIFGDNIANYNSFINKYSKVKFYAYFIDTDVTFDFNSNSNYEVFNYLKENLNVENIDKLDLNGYGDYQRFFYKTDHHWNYQGSYKGYIDIIAMIKPKDKILDHGDLKCFTGAMFWGSKARKIANTNLTEQFCAYNPSLSSHSVLVDEKNNNYGKKYQYFKGIYIKSDRINYYSDFYGQDKGEIIYNFNNKNNNLLILSNSYSNAIDDLIASHFNKTFVVDLRHYQNMLGKQFNFETYIQNNNIDTVLLVGDGSFFSNNEFILGSGM